MKKYLVLVAVVLTLVVGCSRLTRENYEKLKVGMGYDEVVAILGKPDSTSEALFAKSCTWGDEKKNINVTFIGNRVTVYTSTNLK